jgi:hypothetical protein
LIINPSFLRIYKGEISWEAGCVLFTSFSPALR